MNELLSLECDMYFHMTDSVCLVLLLLLFSIFSKRIEVFIYLSMSGKCKKKRKILIAFEKELYGFVNALLNKRFFTVHLLPK